MTLGSIDVLFTNPPFGANIVIDDRDVLIQYDLAAVWDYDEEEDEWKMRIGRGWSKSASEISTAGNPVHLGVAFSSSWMDV